MIQALKSKKVSSKFQILVEVAEHQPTIRQKDIATKMDITPQAVSEYVKEMIDEGLIHTDGKKMYVITREGVNFVLSVGKEMKEYLDHISNIVTNISVWAAVAAENLAKEDPVHLFMEDGTLYASKGVVEGVATAKVVVSAKKGEDVGVSNINGIIPLETGKIIVCTVPLVQDGGSRSISNDKLRTAVGGSDLICAVGIEAHVALKQIGVEPHIVYGVREVIVEAAKRGISPVLVCVESEIPSLLKRLGEDAIEYEFVDVRN